MGDPLSTVDLRWLDAVAAMGLRVGPRGAHVDPRDPLLSLEHRALHAPGVTAPALSLGVHAKKGDPLLSVEGRAMHAPKGQNRTDRAPIGETPRPSLALVAVDADADAGAGAFGTLRTAFEIGTELPTNPVAMVTGTAPQPVDLGLALPRVDARPTTRATMHKRSARRGVRFVPAAGAVAAVVVGLGGGSAVAYVVSEATGHGTSGVVMAGKPVSVAVTAATGPGDLLPGSTGSAYFRLKNTGSSEAVFEAIAAGATIVSNDTTLCGDQYVSIAHPLPYTLPTPLTVRAGRRTGTQTIAGLVALAPDAPSTCQGVTFTVTFTLSGGSL